MKRVAFCLLRGSGVEAGPHRLRGMLLHTSRLTIGSGAGQDLQVTGEGVAELHAVLAFRRRDRLRLVSTSPQGVIVNGRRRTRITLRPGDVVQIGNSAVTVEARRSPEIAVLRICDPDALQAHSAAAHALAMPETEISLRRWSWTLTIGVAVAFLIIPLGGALTPWARKAARASFLPSDSLWSPGALHSAHQFIGANCNACHSIPFARVSDRQCTTCHADVQHHVDIRSVSVGLFRGQRCADCHIEHETTAALVQRDPRLCTDCHARLAALAPGTALRNVTDFGTAHPEFRLSVTQEVGAGEWRSTRLDSSKPDTFVERSHLRFSHVIHLDPKGIKGVDGDRVLVCGDCHAPDVGGREMQPIRMVTHCSSCHSLRFDEQDPDSAVPHGDLAAMFTSLREHFSRRYLEQHAPVVSAREPRRPGPSPASMTSDEKMRARTWVDEQSLRVAQELMEKRVCADCHEIERIEGGSGFDRWRLAPVRLTQSWMPLSRFSHAAHASQKCTSCHREAARSERSTDILMPRIAQCRTCHGGVTDTARTASTCLMCHQFHIAGRGRFSAPTTLPAPTRHTAVDRRDRT